MQSRGGGGLKSAETVTPCDHVGEVSQRICLFMQIVCSDTTPLLRLFSAVEVFIYISLLLLHSVSPVTQVG